MKSGINKILARFKSPVVWLAVIGLIYTTVLVPNIKALPDWTQVLGFLAVIFGITNNPTDNNNY